MSHSDTWDDPHSDHGSDWPQECVKCGVGPAGSDCALLNGGCEHFDPDGVNTILWMEQANPGFVERVLAGKIVYNDPELQKRAVEKLRELRGMGEI